MLSKKTKKTSGLILLATAATSFAMFAVTYFAMADNKNTNSLFLDSDQDGLTDQEEKMIGTDPNNPETGNCGYTDGEMVNAGFNPITCQRIIPASGKASTPQDIATALKSQSTNNSGSQDTNIGANNTSANLLDSLSTGTVDQQTLDTMSADPNNLTNQVVDSFLQKTLDKSQSDSNFTSNPSFSADDLSQIVQNSLSSSDVSKSLPVIRDDEMKVLPQIDSKKLSADEVKTKEKEQVQKYLASIAYIFATNSPFTVSDSSNLLTNLQSEQSAAFTALTSGDQTKIDDYAKKARSAIDQIKQIDVPYNMKDFHKSALQLAIYTLDFKDKVVVDPKDPVKNLAAFGSLEAISQSATKLQDQLSTILQNYGIDTIALTQ